MSLDDNVVARLDRIENYIIEIIQRLAVQEEKTAARSVFYGTMGGVLPTIGLLIWWLVSK